MKYDLWKMLTWEEKCNFLKSRGYSEFYYDSVDYGSMGGADYCKNEEGKVIKMRNAFEREVSKSLIEKLINE